MPWAALPVGEWHWVWLMLWRESSFLWLLVVVAALAVLVGTATRRRRRAVGRFAEDHLVERLLFDHGGRERAVSGFLRLSVLLFTALALAGPRWGFHWEEVRREGIDLIVAVDTSRSMLAGDVRPNRLERAKLAVEDLVDYLEGDRIGLVAFAGATFLECPLTLDYAAFQRSLRALQVGIVPRGGTALARAIDASLEAFEARQGKYQAVILITDGEDHEGDVEAAAQRAADAGVKVYTVGIGTTDGELVPIGEDGQPGFVKDDKGQVVKSRLDDEPLQQIAATTGGAYVRGLGPALGLDQVFTDYIAKMERREVKSTLEKRYEKRFQIPLAMALFALLAETIVDRRSRGFFARLRSWVKGDSGGR